MLIQLDPPIPVSIVAGNGYEGPTGKGMAIGWWNPGMEHHLVWIVFLDASGQCWEVENTNIRARANITWGRPHPEPIRERQ